MVNLYNKFFFQITENYEGQENEMHNCRVSHECKNLIYDLQKQLHDEKVFV